MTGLITSSGSTKRTQAFLSKMAHSNLLAEIAPYAAQGVAALAATTPKESGLTASSWSYEVEVDAEHAAIYWTNSHENEGVNIAVIIQYGHATGTGGYITGIDYINPTMLPIFEQIAENIWKKVTLA